MLGLLHVSLLFDIADPWSRALLISHLGVFLLWQPVWRGEGKLTAGAMVLIGAASLGVLFWLNWWLVAFWLSGLFALIGGRVFSFQATWLRVFYLTAMAYLLLVLLAWVVPHLFAPVAITETTREFMKLALPVLPLAMALIPLEDEPPGSPQVVDFLYSLMLFMLALVVVLGSYMFMTLGKMDYLEALVRTVFMMAMVLLMLGWLWNPRFGFTGLQQMFSSYLLNVGTPFEHWLTRLAQVAETERDAAGFLESAVRELASLSWVRGVEWRAPDGEGKLGETGPHRIRLQAGQLSLELSTRYRISPAVMLHVHLLAQLIGKFYEAKRRENALRQITRLQAIYETGARLTHDVKNLLQSLYSLASAAKMQAQGEDFQGLLKRQLPQLTERLELTLSKLQAPQSEPQADTIPAAVWWESLKIRYEGRHIRFSAELEAQLALSASMFDCVVDNLLDNARKKRLTETGIVIAVNLKTAKTVTLTICDSGTPLPELIASRLFHASVTSETGLGIGLYQAASYARQYGYRLWLKSNRDGAVCFELSAEIVSKETDALDAQVGSAVR